MAETPFAEDDDGLEGEDEEEEYMDCAMDRDGGCGLAGTEQCDFECPYEKPWNRKKAAS